MKEIFTLTYTHTHTHTHTLTHIYDYRSGNSSQPIWGTNMFSSSSDMCYNEQNSCPSTSVSNCSHSEDVTIECGKYRQLT